MKDDIFTKIRSGEYDHKLTYTSPSETRSALHSIGTQICNTLESTHLDDDIKTTVFISLMKKASEYLREMDRIADANTRYAEEGRDIIKRFHADLAEYNGVEGNPNEQRLFSLSWQYGHDESLGTVAAYYIEMSDNMATTD